MHRFKIAKKANSGFCIEGEELHHLVKVLRLQVSDEVVGFDNSGGQWMGIIESIDKEHAYCRIIEEQFPAVEAKTQVYVVMGLAKGEKIEWVIQKGTELGMAGFIPLRTKRSVVQLEGQKAEERVRRWQKIAGEAVKQSRRVTEPNVMKVADWQDLAEMLPQETQWLIPFEEEKTTAFKTALQSINWQNPLALLIGPEGGFSSQEIEKAQTELKAVSVSLGPRILRTETAALTALIMVLAHFGDLG